MEDGDVVMKYARLLAFDGRVEGNGKVVSQSIYNKDDCFVE
jgi:hypothetical protein